MDAVSLLISDINSGMYDHILNKPDIILPVNIEHKRIKNQKYDNPFFVSIDNNVITNIVFDVLKKQYARVIILCLNVQYDLNEVSKIMFSERIRINDTKKIAQQLVLVHSNISILKSKQYRWQSILVSKAELEIFNHNNLELNTEELVLPLLNLDITQVNNYLANNDIIFNRTVSAFYSASQSYQQANKMLLFSELTEYWTRQNKCRINIMHLWSKRSITYKPELINEAQVIVKKINSGEIDNNDTNIDHYHLSVINETPVVYMKRVYDMDLSPMTIETFNMLYCGCTNEFSLYLFLNTILASRDNYHYILNNYDMMSVLSPLINKYLLTMRYVFGYCWVASYYEECIKKTRILTSDRSIFKLSTACLLPFFPYLQSDPTLNPYLPILVPKKQLDAKNNLWGLKMISDYKEYGIADMKQFTRHFNLFCTRDAKKNLFQGYDWTDTYITGSLMTACAQKNSPLLIPYLLKKIETDADYDTAFCAMLNDKYETSDIDVMIHTKTVYEFIDKVHELISVVKHNIGEKVDMTMEKTLHVIVHIDFFLHQHYDKEYVLKNIHTNELKELVHKVYNDTKFENNKRNRELKKKFEYEAHYKQVDISRMNIVLEFNPLSTHEELLKETVFRKNDIFETKDVDNPVLLRISEGIKFNLNSTLKNSIQCFRLRFPEPLSIVSKFHVCNVRAYYSGKTNEVYMMTSFISSMMTYMNLDLKYVNGKQCSVEIINKNISRGYGLFVNAKEKKSIVQYTNSNEKWKKLLGLHSLQGGLQLNNSIMYPTTPNIGGHYGSYVETYDMFCQEWKNRGYKQDSALDLLKIRHIDDTGNVKPINMMYILEAYSMLKSS